ncbi:MAG TPA: matrixin family metalloprotease, partial [Bryobacteraceae bacterium]
MKRILVLAGALASLSSMAFGYYNWVYFASRTAPFNPIPVRFDLSALSNNTVTYFISDQGPAPLAPGDSTTAIYAEVQAAANAWNSVGSSAVRLQFGGMSTVGTPQSTPGIDVVFDDNMPPGILAQSRPTAVSDVSFITRSPTSFVPIVRSKLQFRKDLAVPAQPSYGDAFFLTAVHEFGHTLGLQHTLTSSVMSTAITRATTKASPLAADDIAGISSLYPNNAFRLSTGSIAGQVLLGGAGVNLASVVALSVSGQAVSAMTNPDGTYLISGIPPGQYYVYAHPLPPPQQGESTAANIVWPTDAAQNPFPANTGFDTQFFPGTREWTQAFPIGVSASNTVRGINFNVQARPGPSVADMQTYAYLGAGGQVPVPAPLLPSGTRVYLVFYADGAVVNNNVAPGLNVSVVGSAAQVEANTLAYNGAGSLRIVVDAGAVSS